jgi:hypothetical protein
MPQYWLTIVMTLLLASLVGYVYFVELPAERTKSDTDTAEKKILPFAERDITGLTVRSDSGEIVLSGKDRSWQITAPLQAEADAHAVESVIRALVIGKVNRVVEEHGAALGPFGLEKPSVVLTVVADGKQETLAVGDPGPISSTLYAMRDSDKKVLLTNLAAKDVLNKSLLVFRKKAILNVDEQEVDQVRLSYPKTEVLLARKDGKDKKKWAIRYPIEALADQPEAKTLLMKLQDLKAVGFIDPGPQYDEQMKRLTKPDIKITMHARGGDQAVKLFQPDPATGEAFAVTGADAPIYRINPMVIKDLTKDVFALQDKRLLGVERDDIGTLEVNTRGQHYTLIRRDNAWTMAHAPGKAVNQEKAAIFVSRVVDLPAELRVVKQPGPLAPYGLSSPSAEFTATTQDGKTTGRLVLGTRTGGLVYAMGRALHGIYQARADLLDQVPATDELLVPPSARP